MTGLQAHLLGDICSKRGPPAQVAEENEFLRLGKHGMVVWALRINPELEEAARAVECAAYSAFTFQLPDVTQVDEDHFVRIQFVESFGG